MERMGRVKLRQKADKRYPVLIFIGALLLVCVTVEQTSGQTREFRNPFSLPPGVYLATRVHGAGIKEKASTPGAPALDLPPNPLKVKAILISNQIRLASIGQHIVKVGDSIQDEKVLEITQDRVVLGKGNNKRTLLLEQSPVKITVEETK
jgi:hypothetical protein